MSTTTDIKITAEITSEESIPALACANDTDAYPKATITLKVGDETRKIEVWKVGYRFRGSNDPMTGEQKNHSGWSSTKFAERDGATRGDCYVSWDEDAREITIQTGEGMASVEPLVFESVLAGEEYSDRIKDALAAAYDGWTPTDADNSEIYAALVERDNSTTVSCDINGHDVEVAIYVGKHLEQPVYAVENDDDETVYEDADKAVTAARESLQSLLRDAADDLDNAQDQFGRAVRILEKATSKE